MHLVRILALFVCLPASVFAANGVRVEIFEHPGKTEVAAATESGNDSAALAWGDAHDALWSALPPLRTDQFTEPAFAFAFIPSKYNGHGVKLDRSQPFLVRASANVTLPPGEHRLLLRSLTGARLSLDGEQIVATAQLKQRSGDNEAVPDLAAAQLVAGVHLLAAGHKEALATVQGDGRPHVFTLEAFVGGKSIRPEIGELSVSIESADGSFTLLAPAGETATAFDDAGWKVFADTQRDRIERLNAERRRNPAEEEYWKMRHDLARQHARTAPVPPHGIGNPIDRFIAVKLQAGGVTPAPVIDDAAFLRRVTLDTTGLLPTADEVRAFLADPAPERRARLIDRRLADPRWADHWVAYWQDVLAENPNILKGTLNNTGPFRWWLHDALADNLAADRFATQLVLMEGSAQYGGAAGFGIASQNDLPMAAKAQILSSAFLANELKCARCHDAPYHPFNQEDLLGLAAMLERAVVKVPGTSLTQGLAKSSLVTVSLKPGQAIDPHWPFAATSSEPLPGVIRSAGDSREKLAAILTDPRHERFTQVLANRLWKRFLGFGIVEPVDDWSEAAPSHPELLAWLGRELQTHNYDLKHIARLILTSQTYQRAATAEGSRAVKGSERLFAATARRRMTAEQLVDSLCAVAGKEFDCEMMTQDPECRQAAKDHTNLGVPRRAWEFGSLSNERDRPALAKPRAQVFTDILAAFGWRESRAEPRSTRDHDANVLQPALLANGVFGARIVRLTDDSALTALALTAQPVAPLVTQLFERTLSRPPSAAELGKFTQLLEPRYSERCTGAAPAPPPERITKAVSWANHLNPDATRVVLEIEKQVKAGAPPTPRLNADWRERMEDAVWALMLSPEFVYLP